MSINKESFRKTSYFKMDPESNERKFYHVHDGLAKVNLSHPWGDFTRGGQTFWLLKAYSQVSSSIPPNLCPPPKKTRGLAAS